MPNIINQIIGLIPLLPCDEKDCRDVCDSGWKNPVFGELIGAPTECFILTEDGGFLLDEEGIQLLLETCGDPLPEVCFIVPEDGGIVLGEQEENLLLETCGGALGYQSEMTYENDFSTFLIDIPIYNENPDSVTAEFELEKLVSGIWKPSVNLNSNNFGQLFSLNSITGHPSYAGYAINWGSILFHKGVGCYRFKVKSKFTTNIVHEECLVSPPFDLKKWDCMRAHGTVKFETWLTGTIGDPYKDYYKHDLCGIEWYDSIRFKGFFGYQKSPEYKTENLEWGAPFQGKIEHVRDEQIQRWEFLSGYLPEYIHTRFSTFAMMCDKTFVSDYNINNSDYTLKRKNVIKDSGYEPEYIDKEAHFTKKDKAKVQLFFKRGVQSVEKSICCNVISSGGGGGGGSGGAGFLPTLAQVLTTGRLADFFGAVKDFFNNIVLNFNTRDLPVNWTTIAPVADLHIATKKYVDDTAGGTGDVVGPASSVNNRIAVYDGVTGKLIKDGGKTIANLDTDIAGKVPLTRILTIGGNAQNLSTDKIWIWTPSKYHIESGDVAIIPEKHQQLISGNLINDGNIIVDGHLIEI